LVRFQILFAAALLAAAPQVGHCQEQATHVVPLATGSPAGVYFPVGVALCRLVNEHRREHGIRCAAEPSKGSVDNIDRLGNGDVDLAIVQSDIQADAYEGRSGRPFDSLRAVMSLYPEPLTIVTRADADIPDLARLQGKRISVGPAGSGQRALWDVVMTAEGWTQDDFAATLELPATDQARALCDNQIDSFVTAIGHPALTVQEATLSCDARLVPLSDDVIDRITEGKPYYFRTTIPANLYRGNSGQIASFGVGATVVTRADVADDVVYSFVHAALENLERLRGLNPVLSSLDAAYMASEGLTAPLHPGARRAFIESGALTN
jgi:uncharacterized protein